MCAKAAMKNSLHTPEMSMRTEGFDANLRGGFLEYEAE